MKIYRHAPYGKTIRVTFSKRNEITVDKRAITIVEATKREVIDTIKSVYCSDMIIGNSKRNDFVKVTIQILWGGKKKDIKTNFLLDYTDVMWIQ